MGTLGKLGRFCAVSALVIAMAPADVGAFQYSGYGRSGIAQTVDGGEQFCFKLDGVNFKYRLGNECETYWEVRLNQNLYKKGDFSFDMTTLWVLQTPQYFDYEQTDEGVDDTPINDFGRSQIVPRETFIQSRQLAGWAQGSNFWAGKRFYQRHDVHMIDYYYFSDGTPGGGWENIDVGLGRLSVAWLRNTEFAYVKDRQTESYSDSRRVVPNSQIDVRWAGLPVTRNGELEVALLFGYASPTRRERLQDGATRNGWLTFVEWTQGDVFRGFNKLTFQAGLGCFSQVSMSQDDNPDGVGRNTLANQSAQDLQVPQMLGRCFGASRNIIDDDKPWSARILDWGVFDFNERFGMLYVGMYEHAEGHNGSREYEIKHWSFGARFAYNWGRIMSTQLEVGFSHIDRDLDGMLNEGNDASSSTALGKITLAPLVWKAGRNMFSRPEIRTLVTYANWDETGALDSGIDEERRFFGDSKEGWTIGLQCETWF